MVKVCSKGCPGTDPKEDPSSGQSYCGNCGFVIESQAIRNEIQFSENANGSAGVIGTLVSHDYYSSKSAFGMQYGYRNSRELTLSNSKRVIQGIAGGLNLKTGYIDMAQNYYRLALSVKFTQGRPTRNVAAACLYLVCRKEETSHILLDFSDVLQVNVYSIGSVFLKLCEVLHISDLPVIDPCMFVHRFAMKMEFGEKTAIVEETANRIVQRMKRDWMHHGRRPVSLCGAALLLAARMNNFSRTMKDIVDSVKMCDITIRNRLQEFASTESGSLTSEEFMLVDMERDADPPAFLRARAQAIIAQKTITDAEGMASKMDGVLAIESGPSTRAVVPVNRVAGEKMTVVRISDDPDNLEDVDDHEIQSMLLTNGEVQVKTQMWTQLNKDWLVKAEEKEAIDRFNRANGIEPPKRKQKRKRIGAGSGVGGTDKDGRRKELEATLEKAKLSRKLNYTAIAQLEGLENDINNNVFKTPADITTMKHDDSKEGVDVESETQAVAGLLALPSSAVSDMKEPRSPTKRKVMTDDADDAGDFEEYADDYNDSDEEKRSSASAMRALLGNGPVVANPEDPNARINEDGEYQFSDDEDLGEEIDF
eukprot:CFRG0546T1